MPMGTNQANNIVHATLDVWEDVVYFNAKSYPAGYFATEILNIPFERQKELCNYGNRLTILFNEFMVECLIPESKNRDRFLSMLKDEAMSTYRELRKHIPFSLIPEELDRRTMETIFTPEYLQAAAADREKSDFFVSIVEGLYSLPFIINTFGIVVTHLADHYLSALKKRDVNHFAVAVHDCFNSEEVKEAIKESADVSAVPMTLTPTLRFSYVFARDPKNEKEMVFVRRVIFDSYMDFFVYDLINGLSHGHAPSKCQCCGRYFLTTTGHSPKYCDGMAPQNPTMTCRQYGARQGQKEDNPDHPIYRLFSTRTNTIRKHAERKKIDAETRAAALELAREYRDKALMDRDYFLNGYAQDMELESIYAEAKKRLS